MLAKCMLASPAAGHRLRCCEILRRVKSHLQRWSEGDLAALCSEAMADGQTLSRHQSSSPTSSQQTHNIRRAKLAVQNGQHSKAIKALTSKGLATPSPEVLQEMLCKHPQGTPPALPSGQVPPPARLHQSVILKGVRSFLNGSAPGPSGLRPSHLREAVECPSPDSAYLILTSLSNFVNLLAAGQAPSFVLPHLCGATLLACPKKRGGHRPIAVGEVLRQLVSKSLVLAISHSAFSALTPLQLGVCVKGGCEAIIHAVSKLTSSSPADRRWTLQLDFCNAFNNINRNAMFVEIRRCIPSISAWMESCYSCQPLLLGKDSIHSCCGVQQGDPLGPPGFALSLHPLVERIKAEAPGLALNAWYLDDGTLVGSPEDLAAALHIVKRDSPSLGLHLNCSKSLLFIPDEVAAPNSPLPSDIPIIRRGFCLLGCPVCPPDYCEEVFRGRLAKLRVSLVALLDMGDSQLETTLLHSCLALPKVSFVLHACPRTHICQAATDFDRALREALESIMGGPLSDWSLLKVSLRSSLGGLNLSSASLHAPAAFLAACSSSQSLVEGLLGHPPSPSPTPT